MAAPGAGLSPDPRRLDDPQRLGGGGINSEMGRVQRHRAVSGAQRRNGPARIAGVAANDVGKYRLVVRPVAVLR